MKCLTLIALLAGVALGPTRALRALTPSPVSRVAQLLKDLAEKIDSELDAETKLYDDYVCWAKNVVSSKTASNEKAQSRVDSMTTYLADLKAGRIELTTERTDLEKEVNTLQSDLEKAENLRNQEHSDYKAATNEMNNGIKSLEAAIKVLDDATAAHKKGALVSLRARISQSAAEGESEGFGARVEEAQELEKAVDVGSKYLSQADALFLQRLLTGEVPQKDWKKLNRKADFKMTYKARSVKIQGTLGKLLQNFKDNKADADKREKSNKETYDRLQKSKDSQLKAAQDSQTKQDVENGAAGVSKADAQSEIKALETQVTDDKKYISETEAAVAEKKKEFVERKGLRVGEIAAINQAISVIHSDGARDLFKRSSSSLVQLGERTSSATAQALVAIRDAANASGDVRLSALATRIALNAGAKFDKVIASVDKMIEQLEQDGKDDAANKVECETDRESDTKESAGLSRDIDELSDDASKLNGEIKQINKEVDEKNTKVKDAEKQIKDAKELRARENTEWKTSDADDTAAIALLQKAAGVLKTFYKDNFAMMQKKAVVQGAHLVTAAGAPPPPPTTWAGGYGGSKKESTGIVGILDVIKADVEKDQKAAKTSEGTAQKEHDTFVKESEDSIKKLKTAISDLNDSKAKKEIAINTKKSTSATKKGGLDAVIEKMKAAAPGCDFLLTNFKVRTDNRKLEMDGLNQAKTILKAENK